MSVIAVVPCLNEAPNLPGLIAHLLADPDIAQIIVADGGSTDGSREIVSALSDGQRVVLMDNPQRIQSAGVNRAVRQYGEGHDWLLRVDAHCTYPDRYASILLRAACTNKATSVVVPMVTVGKKGFQRAAASAQNSILGTGGSAHRHLGQGAFVDHGHHALISLKMFRSIGGYCEAMPCNEDAEFDHRQSLAGGRIWLEPAGALSYFPRSSARSLWKQYYRYGQGRARNLRRHKMRPKLRQMVPLLTPIAILLASLSPLVPLLALPAAAWLLLCLAAGFIIGLRNGGGWSLAAGWAAAVMQLAWACGFLVEWFHAPAASAAQYGLIEN